MDSQHTRVSFPYTALFERGMDIYRKLLSSGFRVCASERQMDVRIEAGDLRYIVCSANWTYHFYSPEGHVATVRWKKTPEGSDSIAADVSHPHGVRIPWAELFCGEGEIASGLAEAGFSFLRHPLSFRDVIIVGGAGFRELDSDIEGSQKFCFETDSTSFILYEKSV